MKKLNSLAFIACLFLILMVKSGLFEAMAAPTADSITITIYADCRDFKNITPGGDTANAHNASQFQSYDPYVLYITGHWTPGPTPGDPNWTFITMDSIAANIFKVTFKYGVGHFPGKEAEDPDLLPDNPGWYFAPTNDWSTQEWVPSPCNVAWDVQRIFQIDITNPDTVVAFKYGVCEAVPLNSLGLPEFSGIDAVKEQNLIVYPNPNNGIIYVDLSSFASKALIEVLDISGKVVTKIENATGKTTVNITGMPSSIYLIRVSDGVSTIYKKVILN